MNRDVKEKLSFLLGVMPGAVAASREEEGTGLQGKASDETEGPGLHLFTKLSNLQTFHCLN